MTEHGLLSVITILVTIAVCLLTLLVTLIVVAWKSMNRKVAEVCATNLSAHEDIWERVNHHGHDTRGNVVIPTAALAPKGAKL